MDKVQTQLANAQAQKADAQDQLANARDRFANARDEFANAQVREAKAKDKLVVLDQRVPLSRNQINAARTLPTQDDIQAATSRIDQALFNLNLAHAFSP